MQATTPSAPVANSRADSPTEALSHIATGDSPGTAYFAHSFDGKLIVTDILIAALAIGVAYHTLWKPSGIAPRIERATSTNGGQAGPPPQEV
ncbi:hypothetical protein ACIRH0_04245 [Streptomyces sp. NPDC093675]|uniref:hypothetical protein n=1 Tax=Streptomyces sp. NPDC093675 TaxID=3366049 RepID=UPI003817EE98